MATKMFPRASACGELLKGLNDVVRPRALLRVAPTPRCLASAQHCVLSSERHNDALPWRQRKRPFSILACQSDFYSETSPRLRRSLPIWNIHTRTLSDSRVDVSPPLGDENKGTESRSLEEIDHGSSEHSHSDGKPTVTPDEEVSEKQSVGLVGRSDQPTPGNALTRPEPDDNEMNLLDSQTQIDILAEQESPTILEEFIQPLLPSESLSLTVYAEHSPTLQKLVELGVDLSKVEKRARIGNSLLKMDFDRHIKDKVVFLHRAGVESGSALGRFLTINPFVLTEELEDLETRLLYLKSKKFTDEAIAQVLNRAPYFINFSVERIDSKLGFYQKELSLSGDEIRHMITRAPKLVTFKIQRVKENIFVFRQQLGFTSSELKTLLLREPKLLLRGKEKLIGVFDYMHNHMGVPHKQLLKSPQVFNGRVYKIQERHQFLKQQGRAQYDPTQPNYVPLERLAKLPDHIFCQDIAKSSIKEYNDFLKTL